MVYVYEPEEFLQAYTQGTLPPEHITSKNQLLIYSGPGEALSSWVGELVLAEHILTPYTSTLNNTSSLQLVTRSEELLGALRGHTYTAQHLLHLRNQARRSTTKPSIYHLGADYYQLRSWLHKHNHPVHSIDAHLKYGQLQEKNLRKTLLTTPLHKTILYAHATPLHVLEELLLD